MDRRGDSRRQPCCPKFPPGEGPGPAPCTDRPTVLTVRAGDAEPIDLCGFGFASGPAASPITITFSGAVSGVDTCSGGCPSCNIRLFQCVSNENPGDCVLGAPACAPFAPDSVSFNGTDTVTIDIPTFPPPLVLGLPQFYQLYVGGVVACPIFSTPGCLLVPFCCNFFIQDIG